MTTTNETGTLTPDQIAELKARLLEKQQGLKKVRSVRREERRDATDEMDAATDATEDAEVGFLSDQDQRLRVEIADALTRLAEGSYGLSEDSGEPIGYPRLRAVPWARLTIQEEEERERELRERRR